MVFSRALLPYAGSLILAATVLASAVAVVWADEPATTAPAAEQPIVETPREELSPDELQQLVTDLDHNEYAIREAATRQLIAAGPAAFDLLVEAAEGVQPEPAVRALHVLLTHSRSDDPDVAIAALERLAKMKAWPTHRRTAQARIGSMAEQLAIREVERLGGVAQQTRRNEHADTVIVHLHLGEEWKGGAAGFEQIQRLRSLQTLTVYYADIGDEAIARLEEMPQLLEVQLFGTDATDKGVDALRQRFPQANVQHRKGALLGVRGTAIPGPGGGAHVDDVTADSAAQKAGIQPGDLITHVNGNAIADFSGLTEAIGGYKPGEKAELTLRRGDEEIDVEVEFGKWRLGLLEP